MRVKTDGQVPLKEMMASPERFHLVTTEMFAPFCIVTEYDDDSFNLMLDCVERIDEVRVWGLVFRSGVRV